MGFGAQGKAKNRMNKGAKNIKAANYIIDYQLSHRLTCEEIGKHRPDDKLLPGKTNIDSYLKSLGFNADEELRTNNGIPGHICELRDKVYETFRKNKFRDDEWFIQIDRVAMGQTRSIKPEYIRKAVEEYNDLKNDEYTTRSANKIETALRLLSLPVPTFIPAQQTVQAPKQTFATISAAVNVAAAVQANAYIEFQNFMVEACEILANQKDISLLIEKYGQDNVNKYYMMMMKLGNSLYENLHMKKMA